MVDAPVKIMRETKVVSASEMGEEVPAILFFNSW